MRLIAAFFVCVSWVESYGLLRRHRKVLVHHEKENENEKEKEKVIVIDTGTETTTEKDIVIPKQYGHWWNVEFSKSPSTIKNDDTVANQQQQDSRIIGGSRANEKSYPFFVYWNGCGASLINHHVVLTAAHCLDRKRINPMVRIGAYHSNGSDGLKRTVTGFVVHPEYRYEEGRLVSHDYALLVLGESVNASDIEPVRLNRNNDHPRLEEEELTVIGMGFYEYNSAEETGIFAEQLQELTVPYVPHEVCFEKYGNFLVTILEETNFCAGGKHLEDACIGDSGGPILDGNGLQVGIVSFGVKCGGWGWPGVYSRISSVVDWIDEFICLNAENRSDDCLQLQPRFSVQFNITSDNYPNEISWGIWKESESYEDPENIFLVPLGVIGDIGVSSKTLRLSPGTYMMKIQDATGDGICCEFGEGNITITSGEYSIQRSGRYDHNDTVPFVITESGRLLDLSLYQLRVDITYDNRPNETAWRLDNIDVDVTEFVSHFGDVTSPGLVSSSFPVVQGRHWLVVIDSKRDGICCDHGDGSIKIYKIVNHQEELIASHYGNFSWRIDFEFDLP